MQSTNRQSNMNRTLKSGVNISCVEAMCGERYTVPTVNSFVPDGLAPVGIAAELPRASLKSFDICRVTGTLFRPLGNHNTRVFVGMGFRSTTELPTSAVQPKMKPLLCVEGT